MTEPTKQRKVWPVLSLLALIVLAGIGYYLDPEGELVQELTGIRLSALNRGESPAVSPIAEQAAGEQPVVPQVEIQEANENPPEVVTKVEEEVAKTVDKKPEEPKVAQDIPEPPAKKETDQVPIKQDSPAVEPEYKFGDLRAAVGRRDTAQIVAILRKKPDFVRMKDPNGWGIVHEAARAGLTESVRALVEHGNVNLLDKAGKNGDLLALDIALRYLKSETHPTVIYLKSETGKLLKSSKVTTTGVSGSGSGSGGSSQGDELIKTDDGLVLRPSSLLEAALKNDVRTMNKIIKERPHWVDRKDANGWSVLHEMARAGRLEAVKFLITEGKANVNARTSRENNGGSVLYHAVNRLGNDHPVVRYLTSVGAKQIAPGEKDEL